MKFAKSVVAVFFAAPIMALGGGSEVPAGGLTITGVGVQQSGNLGFFDTAEAKAGDSSRKCPWGYYYVDLSTAAGRAIYATVLTTKNSGRKLARVDWALSGNGSACLVSIVATPD